MGTFILRRTFSKYDDTDALKRMKDSDILAQDRKIDPGYGNVAKMAAGGALAGATVGSIAGGISGIGKGKFGSRFKSGGKWGALAGGVIAGGVVLNQRNKQLEENSFYNNRLAYAQNQARRRERMDWNHNMTQRDGYSY